MTDRQNHPAQGSREFALVHRRTVGAIAFLTIDNPPVNALSQAVRSALRDRLADAAKDEGTQAVVIDGANGTFVAGADLREFGKPLAAPTLPDVIAAIEACPKPVVAAIGGAALGGGYEVALGCDGRVASRNAEVGLPEVDFGIIPGSGGTVRLPRLVDAATALDLIASGRRVNAQEALALGLLDAVADDLREGALSLVRTLDGRKRRLRDLPARPADPAAFERAASAALRRGRNRPCAHEQVAALRRATADPVDEALTAERAAFDRLRGSDDSAALRHLFFARRQAARVAGADGVKPRQVRRVGIVGAGTMGSGIAAAFLLSDLPVTLVDAKPEALAAAAGRIAGWSAKRGKAAAPTLTDDFEVLADCDLVVEAVFEDMAVKADALARLDAVVRPEAILASNTSYLDLDRLAAASANPERVIGLHFFAPAHVMELLEVVRGTRTSPEVLVTAVALGRSLGKVPVVARVGEGFIGNRIYGAYRRQCESIVCDGALPHEVDRAIEAFGFAMGPFAVGDLSGLDIAWAHRRGKQPGTAGSPTDFPVLGWLVDGGRLGRKTGAGWFRYDEGGKPVPDDAVAELIEQARAERGVVTRPWTASQIQRRAMAAIVNEALLVLADGIAQRPSDIDLVLVHGYGFPRHLGGPLYWAKAQDRGALDEALDEVASTAAGLTRRGHLNTLS